MLHGGHLKDIPLPHKRMWPGYERPRELVATISCYYGIGRHYYAHLQQEDNPIWDGRTNGEASPSFAGTDYGKELIGWHLAWDDKEGDGKNVSPGELDDEPHGSFDTPEQAIAWVERTWRAHFPDHKLEASGGEDWEEYKAALRETFIAQGQFWYSKEGD